MPPSQPPPPPTTHIPLPYRLFHRHIEPLILLPGGIYLALFRPREFILSTAPWPVSKPYHPSFPFCTTASASPAPITPLLTNLLHNTAALYILFMLNELLVLRLSSDVKIWRAVLFAMLCCDLVHLYGMWVAGGTEFMLDPLGKWRAEDWINVCLLAFGAGLRICFLAGVGVRDGNGEKDGAEEKRE